MNGPLRSWEMLKFILPLVILPVLGLSLSQPAAAQQPYWWQGGNPDGPDAQYDDQQGYDPQSVYGPDPYASRTERFDDDQYRAYRREMWRRYHRGHDYQPQRDYGSGYDDQQQPVPYAAPVYPQSQAQGKVLVAPGGKPVVVKKKIVAPAKPATTTASTAPVTTTPPAAIASTNTATASAAPASTAPATVPAVTTPPAAVASASAAPATGAKKGGPVTCDKGASIVSSFGFENVTNKTCDGASLVYSAERGGKPFEIEVNPKSGELTAVKKL